MFCKHCGKEIDSDAKYCKYCGKSLAHEKINFPLDYFSLDKIETYIVPFSLIIIWYALTFVFILGEYKYNYAGENSLAMFSLLWMTPLIYYLFYVIIKKYSNINFFIFIKQDNKTTKIIKFVYIVYSYCLPFVCCQHNDIEEYFTRMSILWGLPSLCLYLILRHFSTKRINNNDSKELITHNNAIFLRNNFGGFISKVLEDTDNYILSETFDQIKFGRKGVQDYELIICNFMDFVGPVMYVVIQKNASILYEKNTNKVLILH